MRTGSPLLQCCEHRPCESFPTCRWSRTRRQRPPHLMTIVADVSCSHPSTTPRRHHWSPTKDSIFCEFRSFLMLFSMFIAESLVFWMKNTLDCRCCLRRRLAVVERQLSWIKHQSHTLQWPNMIFAKCMTMNSCSWLKQESVYRWLLSNPW